MSHELHERQSAGRAVNCAVLTLSDTRTAADDVSGDRLCTLLIENGYTVARRELIRDDAAALRTLLDRWLADEAVDAIISTGGTGVAPRDTTIEVVDRLIERPLPGFGELFRMLSYEQVGAAAMMSRATAGVVRGRAIFALPGSTKAVELAMTRLIVPQLRHLLTQIRA